MSKFSHLGKQSEPRENMRTSGEAPVPRFSVSSRVPLVSFSDIPQMESLLAQVNKKH